MNLCRCGCGKEVSRKGNIYIIGHQRKNIPPVNKGIKRSKEVNSKYKKTVDLYGKGFRNTCLCGCGQKVKHLYSKYCSGHGQKHKPYQKDLNGEEKLEYGKKISKFNKGKTKENCEWRKEAAEKITGLTKENCVWRRRAALTQSISMKKNFEDPVFLKKFQQWIKVKPNYPETFLIKLLNNLFPNKYKYTGDFSFWIGRRNPDFTNENEKEVIEFFGEYYHGEKYRKTINDFKNNSEHENETINYYKNHGYKCLVIWWKNLKDIIDLSNKIISFHGCNNIEKLGSTGYREFA